MISRRELLSRAVTIGGVTTLNRSLFARNQLSLNSTTIDVVTDGRMELPVRMLASDFENPQVQSHLKSINAPTNTYTPPCNLTLVRQADRTILFDVGGGPNFIPTLGRISDSLTALNIAPDDITDVVFTHAHPDHIWGLMDDFDELLFSNAQYYMSEVEFNYWMHPNTLSSLPEDRQAFAAGAKRNIEIIAEQLIRFNDDEEVLPGISVVASYGHTPGHCSFEVRSGSESVLIVGDAIQNTLVSVPHPDWLAPFDQAPQQAAVMRKKLLERISTQQMAVIGFHFDESPFGRIENTAAGFRYIGA